MYVRDTLFRYNLLLQEGQTGLCRGQAKPCVIGGCKYMSSMLPARAWPLYSCPSFVPRTRSARDPGPLLRPFPPPPSNACNLHTSVIQLRRVTTAKTRNIMNHPGTWPAVDCMRKFERKSYWIWRECDWCTTVVGDALYRMVFSVGLSSNAGYPRQARSSGTSRNAGPS